MDLVPADGRTPPIWIAAHGPRMLRLTGQYGDGWYPGYLKSPEDYGDRLLTVRRHAREAGRDPDGIVPSMQAAVFLAPSDEIAREMLGKRFAKFIGLITPDEVFQSYGLTHPLGEGFRGYADIKPEEIGKEELEAAMEAVPEDFLLESMIWGSPEKVAAEVRKFGDAGLRHIVIVPVSVLDSKRILRYLPRGLFSLRRKLQ